MKGYYNNAGYMGYVEGRWMLFASESDYVFPLSVMPSPAA